MKQFDSRGLLAVFVSLFAMAGSASAQTTWFVDAGGTAPGSGTSSDPYVSLQFALSQPAVLSGDTLQVASGDYAELIDFLGKEVHVLGTGASRPRLLGSIGGSTVTLQSGEGVGAILENVEVLGSGGTSINGSGHGGGALLAGSSGTFRDVVFTDCQARYGGGIAVRRGRLVLEDCLVEGCEAQRGGGIDLTGGALFVRGSSAFIENVADFQEGGAIHGGTDSYLHMENTRIERNEAGAGGGLFFRGSGELDGVLFKNNSIGSDYVYSGGGADVTAIVGRNCRFEGNGGFLCFRGAGAAGGHWIDSEFIGNLGECFGAGLADGLAENCVFQGNRSIAFQGDVPAVPGGGAAFSTLMNCLLEGNSADESGGGAYECDLVDCVVRNNRAGWRDIGDGGGLSRGTAVRCLLEGNRVERDFGAPSGAAAFDVDFTQCVIRDHFGEAGVISGGSLDRCTVMHNVTGDPTTGVIRNSTIANSIVWANGPTQLGPAVTATYSAVEGGTGGVGNFATLPGTYGPGSDLRLAPGSPCIDAGDPMAPSDPDGSRADVGAFPFDPSWVTEGGAFCGGSSALILMAPVSASLPGGTIQSATPVTAFLLSTSNEPALAVFPASQTDERPQTLCLTGRILRVVPGQSPTQLSVDPPLVSQLGAFAGDRLLIQGWLAGVGFTQGLDVIVQP